MSELVNMRKKKHTFGVGSVVSENNSGTNKKIHIHSLICSTKNVWNFYYVPDTILGSGGLMV